MVAIRNCKFLLAVTGWADSKGNERSSRSCKIAAFGIGGQGKPSAGGGRPPLRLGAVLAGKALEEWGAVWRGKTPKRLGCCPVGQSPERTAPGIRAKRF